MVYSKVKKILDKEINRQNTTIELIASENFASQAVMDLCGSVFTNKYAEGYSGKRYYNGCKYMDEIEDLATEAVTSLYECKFANVQPHSGVNANTAVYQALMKPGDVIMGMDLASGGHLSHGAPPTLSGKVYNSVTYGVDEDGLLNYEEIRALAKVSRPNVIVAGASAYPRQIDWKAFKDIADGVGAFLVADMAHYSGLVAGKVYDSPLPYADVVTSTTHKTLRGPRGGMILWNNPNYSKKINSSIFPGTQGGPLMNIIAAKAQCYLEALEDSFKVYSKNVIDNAKAMAQTFEENGLPVLTGGTDSHIILIDLSKSKISGREAADKLEENGITVNKNGVPNDPRNFIETSGIRIGTAAETTKGHDKKWFTNLAKRIIIILNG
jgi:glycine hydroxymethyltransferase|tara:strand:- start:1999 stop:3144 length:1146 start_codon:yes stop_codon:yes gene_type:complete